MNQESDKVNVFSQKEKDQIKSEFEYYNQKRERLDCNGQDSDPFAEHLLVSTQNCDLKNVTTHSFILAPFNSSLNDETEIRLNQN